jgi:hypothetical protein
MWIRPSWPRSGSNGATRNHRAAPPAALPLGIASDHVGDTKLATVWYGADVAWDPVLQLAGMS